MQFQHCEDCPSKFRSLHIMAELSCHAHAGCAKRRKPSTNIMIGGRKLKDVIEVNICLRGQCKLPCNCYLGSTSIVKLSSKPSLSSSWPLPPQNVVPRLGPWHGTGGLDLTLHAPEPAAAFSNACLSRPGLHRYAHRSAGLGNSDKPAHCCFCCLQRAEGKQQVPLQVCPIRCMHLSAASTLSLSPALPHAASC